MTRGAASPTRAVFAGGHTNPSPRVDTIDYIQFMTTGNAGVFGNLSGGIAAPTACSNGHGGLG